MGLRAIPAIALMTALAACGGAPSAPTATATAASIVSPSNGTEIANVKQPVQLTAATSADAAGGAYTFEVAKDPAFAIVVHSVSVAPAGAQTTAMLPTLPTNLTTPMTYYWRVRSSATTSAVSSFSIGPSVVIDTPIVTGPSANVVQYNPPTLSVLNATRVGTTGSLLYRFDLATDTTFTKIVATGAVSELSNATTYRVSSLTAGSYYWRVQVSDSGTGAASAFTKPQYVEMADGTLPPPQLVSPVYSALTDLQPTLTVRLNPPVGGIQSGPFLYEFDVARDFSFTSIVASATVSEGVDTTSWRVPTALAPGVAYFWRARTRSLSSGRRSADGGPRGFVTNGATTGPARLVVRPPSTCTASFNRDFTFNGTLTVSDGAMHFVLPEGQGANRGNLVLDFVVSGALATGTLHAGTAGTQTYDVLHSVFGFSVSRYFGEPAPFTGTMSAGGVLTATIAGYMLTDQPSTGNGLSCEASNFALTLTPGG